MYYLRHEQACALRLSCLTNEQKGELLTGVLDYVKNGTEPNFENLALKISFNIIRNTINRDTEKYEDRCLKNAQNGKKGGRPKKQSHYEESEKSEWLLKKPKKADNDNDKDNDNDNDIINKSTSSFPAKKVCACEKCTNIGVKIYIGKLKCTNINKFQKNTLL